MGSSLPVSTAERRFRAVENERHVGFQGRVEGDAPVGDREGGETGVAGCDRHRCV